MLDDDLHGFICNPWATLANFRTPPNFEIWARGQHVQSVCHVQVFRARLLQDTKCCLNCSVNSKGYVFVGVLAAHLVDSRHDALLFVLGCVALKPTMGVVRESAVQPAPIGEALMIVLSA